MMNNIPKPLLYILGLNTLIFVLGYSLQVLSGISIEADLYAGNSISNNIFTLLGSFNAFAIRDGAVWLFITSNFVHLDLFHFAVNMYALIVLGQAVDTFYDKRFLTFTYVLGGLVSGIATYAYFLGFGSLAFSVGASGGIFAYLGLLLAGAIKDREYGGSLPININSLIFPIILTVGIGFISGLNINNVAHFGGFIAGFALGYIFPNSWNSVPDSSEQRNFKIAYNTSLLLVALSFGALVIRATLALF